ncbi:MAG: GTP-binding protein [Candidatus Altiarchaeales archaeon]|nr:GTP-binding protein [Candidatus Altiarchaeales archaeon]MBD3416642.1 GTP-binding protein [Candidatus Altiarchaeales archaeon]
MFNLPYVPTADDLIDKAFRAGAKKSKTVRGMSRRKPEKALTAEIKRVEQISAIVEGDLNAVVKHFPSYEELSEFHQALLDLRVKKDRYKKSLGAVKWCSDRVSSLKNKTLRKLKTQKDLGESRVFLGRVSSFIKRVRKDLDYLVEVKGVLLSFPFLKDEPTLVVAGVPNAGKSTFVRTLTGSKVKIASYPFTTTEIMIGYRKVRYMEYQVIDSPGILDRPMEDRNRTELQAVLAIEHLADVVLFIIDPESELENQLRLLDEIEQNFNLKVHTAVNDKGGENPKGYETFNATKEEDCLRLFKECIGLK